MKNIYLAATASVIPGLGRAHILKAMKIIKDSKKLFFSSGSDLQTEEAYAKSGKVVLAIVNKTPLNFLGQQPSRKK